MSDSRMNPWNRAVMVWAWAFVAIAAGGTYLAHDRNIASVALLFMALVLSIVLHGSDREDTHE